MDPADALKRAPPPQRGLGLSEKRGRFEAEQMPFTPRIQEGFKLWAAHNTKRIVVLAFADSPEGSPSCIRLWQISICLNNMWGWRNALKKESPRFLLHCPFPFLSKTSVARSMAGSGRWILFLSGQRPPVLCPKREAMRNVTIFTDGSCLGNPGRGGWGCILRCEGHEKELSGGYAHHEQPYGNHGGHRGARRVERAVRGHAVH